MTAAARQIWREIVSAKPVDWFDGASRQLLRLHCENTARANRVSRDLARVKPGLREGRELAAELKLLSLMLTTSARQLRLTVQHAVDVEGQKARERGVAGDGRRLIGGRALKVVE